jgi:hypothetical protein
MTTTLSSGHGVLEFEQSRSDVAGNPGWRYISIDGCGPSPQSFVFDFVPARKVIQFPDWLPLMFCTAAAIGPWLRWRFSLRTLLIATTLIAVVLGLAVYAATE